MTHSLKTIALSAQQKAMYSLLFIQTFSTIGFAVLYSTLVLYATKELGFSDTQATVTMGVFGAFNYGLHLLGGLVGGRFLSNRNLFIIGMLLQITGCYSIAEFGQEDLYWGLAFFLTGSGLNVTCINMMVTQRFAPDDPAREKAFLYNYAGMNLGFFIGFAVAGYFQNLADYESLFLFAACGSAVAAFLCTLFYKHLKDLNTPLESQSKSVWLKSLIIGFVIILVLIPSVKYALESAAFSGQLVIAASLIVFSTIGILAFKNKDTLERKRMFAYLLLAAGALIFWSLYQLAPMGLALFADRNVNMWLAGLRVAPQWIQNINTVVIVIGGPVLANLFIKLRKKGINFDIPLQFALSLGFIGLGFLVLPLGIHLADSNGLVSLYWLGISYVLQSIGELLISPIGYAMIGKLAPARYQGGMMGAWMLVTGVASIIAAQFSGMMPPEGSPLVTDEGYSSVFAGLGLAAVLGGVVLYLIVPRLRNMIQAHR